MINYDEILIINYWYYRIINDE